MNRVPRRPSISSSSSPERRFMRRICSRSMRLISVRVPRSRCWSSMTGRATRPRVRIAPMRARNSCSLTGLSMNSSTGRRYLPRSAVVVSLLVRKTKGISRVTGLVRSSWQSLKPSTSGSSVAVTISCGGAARALFIARAPSVATATSWPARRRIASMSRRTAGSPSATRTRAASAISRASAGAGSAPGAC